MYSKTGGTLQNLNRLLKGENRLIGLKRCEKETLKLLNMRLDQTGAFT